MDSIFVKYSVVKLQSWGVSGPLGFFFLFNPFTVLYPYNQIMAPRATRDFGGLSCVFSFVTVRTFGYQFPSPKYITLRSQLTRFLGEKTGTVAPVSMIKSLFWLNTFFFQQFFPGPGFDDIRYRFQIIEALFFCTRHLHGKLCQGWSMKVEQRDYPLYEIAIQIV